MADAGNSSLGLFPTEIDVFAAQQAEAGDVPIIQRSHKSVDRYGEPSCGKSVRIIRPVPADMIILAE
jgi:hypothetical protein